VCSPIDRPSGGFLDADRGGALGGRSPHGYGAGRPLSGCARPFGDQLSGRGPPTGGPRARFARPTAWSFSFGSASRHHLFLFCSVSGSITLNEARASSPRGVSNGDWASTSTSPRGGVFRRHYRIGTSRRFSPGAYGAARPAAAIF
jgi:hypothetical protein